MNEDKILDIEEALTPRNRSWAAAKLRAGFSVRHVQANLIFRLEDGKVYYFEHSYIAREFRLSSCPTIEAWSQRSGGDSIWEIYG